MGQYDFFNQKKISAFGRFGHKVFHEKVMNFLTKEGSLADQNILEVGTGQGEVAHKILEQSGNYKGYEPAKSIYEKLVSNGLNVRNEFVPPLFEDDNSIDQVLLIHVIEHMKNLDQAQDLVIEIKRVLKQGGRLLIVAPDYSDFGPWFYEGDYTHQYPVSLYQMSCLLEDQGFKVNSKKYIWGSWNWFPGYFANQAVKMAFSIFSPLINLIYPSVHKLLKLRCTFGRCIWIEVEK